MHLIHHRTFFALLFLSHFGLSQQVFNAQYNSVDSVETAYAGHGQGTNLVACGRTLAGSKDAVVIKLDSAGSVIWSKSFGGTGYDELQVIKPTHDKGYIATGYTNSFGVGGRDAMLIKFDSSGGVEWCKTFGSVSDDWGRDVIETSTGDFVMVGGAKYNGTANSGSILIVKTDSSGVLIWSRMLGAYYGYEGVSVIEAQGNELLVGGNGSNGFAFLMKVRSGGSQRWVRKSKPFTLQRMNFRQLGVDIKGSYFFSCDGMDPNGYYYLALTHADSAGVVDWARTYQFSTSSAYLYNGGVIQTWDKGYLLNAMLADTISGLLNAKVDSLGFIQDARIYPGPVYDSLNALRFSNSADQGFVCASDTGAMIYKMDGFGFMGCSGTPVVLTVDTPSCFDFSAGSIASAGSAVAQPQVINVTTLQVNSINTCTGTGIRDIKNYTGLLLFPNPSDGNFYVKAEGVKRVSAFDVAGRCVPIHLEVQQENSFVHLDGPPGIYFIKVITDKGAFTKKVIIN